jgi:DNA-directed RNA polymerase specialized sigma24 family protein
MPAPESVTLWIDRLRGGDAAAAQKLWEAYFQRLVRLARARLRDLPLVIADEEDVALSAFDSFCRGAMRGRFPRLADRDDLWQVLFFVTQRKAIDLIQSESRDKRDWRRRSDGGSPDAPPAAGLAGKEPDPAFAALVAEECRRLLAFLPDDEARTIAVRKMEGHTNEETAAELGCSLATVERRLKLIRREWGEQGSAP